MSSFGTSGVLTCMVIAAFLAAPMAGWWAVVAVWLAGAGFLSVLQWANENYYPDGTSKRG
jgi:hypothetical protein